METVLFIASILTAALSIALYIYIKLKAPSREQNILAFLATSNVILCIGDCISQVSESEEAALAGLSMSFFGGTFLGFAFFLLLSVIARMQTKKWFVVLNVFFSLFLAVAGCTNPCHHLMYTSIHFTPQPLGATRRELDFGPLFFLYLAWYTLILISCLIVIFRCKYKKPMVYRSLKRPLMAFLIAGGLSYAAFGLSNYFYLTYDFSAIGACLAFLILLITFYNFRTIPMLSETEDSIINSIDDILIACDVNDRIVFANQKASNIYDPDNKLIYGMNPHGFSPELDIFLDTKPGESLTINGKIYLCELLPISSGKQNLGTVHWLKNITAERKFLEETVKLKEQAERANQAKSEFLAQMSHEIRTPINAVLGMNEMIFRESDSARIISYSQDIKRGGQTLLALINDILDFSQIEAQKLEVTPAPYDLPLMLKDLIFSTQTRIGKKNVELVTDFDPKLPRVLYGDVIRVKQVIQNILTNAAKYTEEGSITFRMSYDEMGDDELMLKINVSDTGIGIKKEDLPKLFDSFKRLDAVRNSATEGTGLGMAITKRLLNLMDGCVMVDSVYGEGSNFHIVIPQKRVGIEILGVFNIDETFEKECKKDTKETFKAPNATILVVDDNEVNRKLAEGLLKKTEIKFEEAQNGLEFLKMIEKKHYDLILLDHRMPEMSGVEALEKMNESTTHKCAGVPVIAMTADAGNGSKDFFMSAGFTDYISKPMNPANYENMVKKYLPKNLIE